MGRRRQIDRQAARISAQSRYKADAVLDWRPIARRGAALSRMALAVPPVRQRIATRTIGVLACCIQRPAPGHTQLPACRSIPACFPGHATDIGMRAGRSLWLIPALIPDRNTMVALSRSIFKAYDIRGIIDKTLDAGVARQIGQAFGMAVLAKGETTVVIGRDGRLSGPELAAALAAGLQAAGVDVIDLGVVATPMVYFGTNVLNAQLRRHGHRQPQPARLQRLQDGAGRRTPSPATTITALYDRIVAHDGARRRRRAATAPTTSAPITSTRIIGDIKLARPMKIAVDCGNGVAGAFAGDLFRGIGCEVDRTVLRGRRPLPQPSPRSGAPGKPAGPDPLRWHETDAELGLAFDGDGDRLGVVTKDGQIIFPDRQLMLFAADVLTRNPGAQIMYDVKCTRHLAPDIAQHGGKPLMWKTGHSLVKAKMKETGAPLAGEMSGHIFFKDRWYGFDDGLYAGARLLEILTARGRPVGAARMPCPQSDQHARAAPAAERRRELHADRQAAADARFPGARARSSPSTACAWNTPTASAWRARPTPRRWWCCASRRKRRRRWRASRPSSSACIPAAKPDAALPF